LRSGSISSVNFADIGATEAVGPGCAAAELDGAAGAGSDVGYGHGDAHAVTARGPADSDAAHRPAASGGEEPSVIVVVLEGPAEQVGVEVGGISPNRIEPVSTVAPDQLC
jgi:hypothetical protein